MAVTKIDARPQPKTPKKKVAAYARVSTDNLDQKESLDAQKSIMKCTSKPIQLGSLRDFTLTKAFPEQNLKRETVCRICSVIAMQEKSIIF